MVTLKSDIDEPKYIKVTPWKIKIHALHRDSGDIHSLIIKVSGPCIETLCVFFCIKNIIYPIYTCDLAMAEPWPSEVLFTLGELYPRQTGQPRPGCLGEDLGEGQV